MAASSSSSAFFAMRGEDGINQISQQQLVSSSQAAQAQSSPATTNPLKRKRNRPDPDAEVIALSPKSLMAKNKFVCEVCSKGFQREQNLQLHRRGHNLPWKLRQKTTNKEVRKKVYLCPEPTCVHHDPARALGDLTGVKKHYSRKHGEKKYKCEKCPRKYAVQSDWKAHSKTCGTRDYRCDCGTLFSRRDSFITHRAFCDALAQHAVHQPPLASSSSLNSIGGNLLRLNSPSHDDILRLGQPSLPFESLMGQTFRVPPPSTELPRSHLPVPSPGLFSHQTIQENHQQSSPFYGLIRFPQLDNLHVNNDANGSYSSSSSCSSMASLFNLGFHHDISQNQSCGGDEPNLFSSSNLMSIQVPSLYSTSPQAGGLHNSGGGSAHMSATALLQKAALLGSTATISDSLLRTLSTGGSKSSNYTISSFGNSAPPSMPLLFGQDQNSSNYDDHHSHNLLHRLMMNPNVGNATSIFSEHHDHRMMDRDYRGLFHGGNKNVGFDDDQITVAFNGDLEHARLTRDFLGVGEIVMGSNSVREEQNYFQRHMITSLDRSQQGKSITSQATAAQGFGFGGRVNLQ